MLSGAGPNFSPAEADRQPRGGCQAFRTDCASGRVIMADGIPSWQATSANALVQYGGACMLATGGTFAAVAKLTFTPTATPTVCLDGGDPAFSTLDNFFLGLRHFLRPAHDSARRESIRS